MHSLGIQDFCGKKKKKKNRPEMPLLLLLLHLFLIQTDINLID